ncbi:hypothetical protein ACIA8K_21115 [Catenuloplanes sp. NPDC051500]|uniref:hypothetical protein n=1 Tax=Catenuloplanes sp. NPDC051500 TaxID=3363959 RepID=UPI0037B9FA42
MADESPTLDKGDEEYRPPAWIPRWILELPHVSLDEQARQQGVEPLRSAADLAVPGFFESDEELDEFLADLYESRRRERHCLEHHSDAA